MLFFFNAPFLIPGGSHSHHFPIGSDKDKLLCSLFSSTPAWVTAQTFLSLILIEPDVHHLYVLLIIPHKAFLLHLVLFESFIF